MNAMNFEFWTNMACSTRFRSRIITCCSWIWSIGSRFLFSEFLQVAPTQLEICCRRVFFEVFEP